MSVSIPQAVGTIAIDQSTIVRPKHHRFNTASGRYYCNKYNGEVVLVSTTVSIPQAVGTIAIMAVAGPEKNTFFCFNTASGRYYCNVTNALGSGNKYSLGFNTASGRYYCNDNSRLAFSGLF